MPEAWKARRRRPVRGSVLNRPGLGVVADRLRMWGDRWKKSAAKGAKRDAEEVEVARRRLIGQALDDAADLLEQRELKVALAIGAPPPLNKTTGPKKRVTHLDRTRELLAMGSFLTSADLALALGITKPMAQGLLYRLYRDGEVTRKEVDAPGHPHAYYKP